MAVAKPGPKPVFTERFIVQLRPDQRAALDDISDAFRVSVSEIVRWMLDHGIDACLSNPQFKALPRRRDG